MLEHREYQEQRPIKISDFDYELPQELIAQTPIEPRDSSRLLVVHRATGMLEHRHFRDIGEYLRPGDLLIANQSRVIPARLLGRRVETGGAVEVLLLAERPDLGPDHWETLVRPGRRLHEGDGIVFGREADSQVLLHGEILQRTEASGRVVRLFTEDDATSTGIVRQRIEQLGRMPLPPYIHEMLTDPERYQTVYARISGSAAAPTAGLHFTPHLLDQLRRQGVRVGFVTLHVGLDTFRPVEVEDVSDHKMHSEEIELDAPTAELINETRKAGGRIIAVGTTSVRVLESVAAFYDGQVRTLFRSYAPLHYAGLLVQGRGCHDHQFPPAALDLAPARQCIRKQRTHRESLSRSHSRTLPFFQLWRCDADDVISSA